MHEQIKKKHQDTLHSNKNKRDNMLDLFNNIEMKLTYVYKSKQRYTLSKWEMKLKIKLLK